MHSERTIYRLADNPNDYRACHDILRAHNRPADWKLKWPTVVAVRDNEIIGFLSTNKSHWAVMAGPLELKIPSPFVVLRLIEAYEVALLYMGVSRYCFYIAKDAEHAHWLAQARRLGLTPISETPENIYFERILTSQPLRLAA